MKKYNDTYWTYKDSYGTIRKWNIYVHAKKIVDMWKCGDNEINIFIECDTFQFTSNKELLIKLGEQRQYYTLENKITRKEFINAVSKMLNKAKEAIK